MFIPINGNRKKVNLKNVSNINKNIDRYRVVYNMNYSVIMPVKNKNKQISDYVYEDLSTNILFSDTITALRRNPYIMANFFEWDRGFVNLNEISSIKYETNKIIINLSNPVSAYNHNEEIITSEFVYIKGSVNEIDDIKKRLETKINIFNKSNKSVGV
jgi:hypothetical protein